MEPRWIALFICLLIPAGLAFAIIWIQLQIRRVRRWPGTIGQIESARSVARDLRSNQYRTTRSGSVTKFITREAIETRNFAEISYSFEVAGRTYRGNRIGIEDSPRSFDVATTLQRYPKGKAVTVYYDPQNPQDCILERDDEGNVRNAWIAVAMLAGLILAGFVAFSYGAERLRGSIADPARIPAVIMLAVVSLFLILAAKIVSKTSGAMKKWPKAEGEIVRSEVIKLAQRERRVGQFNFTTRRTIDMYVPRVVYAYEVDGNRYQGDDVGWTSSANTTAPAEKCIRRYPLHARVQVSYDPADPSRSTLAPSAGMFPLVLLLLAAVVGFAAFALGWLIR